MNVLVIDTSNFPLAIAVMNEDEVIAEMMINIKKNHSIQAMPLIETMLKAANLAPKEMDRIVVSMGPGSYTGVRIGVTMAKTLAWTLNIPVVGVSSLAAITGAGRHFNGLVCPVFDARRGQVYTGLYQFENHGLVAVEEDTNILMDSWIEKLAERTEKILFTGKDIAVFWEAIQNKLGDRAVRSALTENVPRASEIGLAGMAMEPGEVHGLVPNYIRLAEAEAKWIERQQQGKVND
ncbi:tRNA (adenosine(37)-N6)-threonylcarbamoyltransferase complex dimerization subunit type 1 TsaB [Jeotgalibacillus marinus]|uniref:tRNA (Adenosine(37)-N6)-threonylcarbamoyltransferase complex dimerization subunit type 1 TsaB n=1 Tax=Jeotgalibacillus marinus TaxID=86667 RepID=A0ABV3Q7K4_9BACL